MVACETVGKYKCNQEKIIKICLEEERNNAAHKQHSEQGTSSSSTWKHDNVKHEEDSAIKTTTTATNIQKEGSFGNNISTHPQDNKTAILRNQITITSSNEEKCKTVAHF